MSIGIAVGWGLGRAGIGGAIGGVFGYGLDGRNGAVLGGITGSYSGFGGVVGTLIGGPVGGLIGYSIGGIIGGTIAYTTKKGITRDMCFPANTPILLDDNTNTPINSIAVGKHVLAYDRFGDLVKRRVSKLYRNVTTEWLELSFTSADGKQQSMTVTPGHRFLNEHGRFEMIADITARGGRMVDADGRLVAFKSHMVVYSADTAHLYEQAEGIMSNEAGNLALKPEPIIGWATYNFEVEDLHTYVACGIRVHNESDQFAAFLNYLGDDSAQSGAFFGAMTQERFDNYVNHSYTDAFGVSGSLADRVGGAQNIVGTSEYNATHPPGVTEDPGAPGPSTGPSVGDVPSSTNTYAPIILDLDGNGIDLVSSRVSTAAFDVDGNGSLNYTGWVGAGDGMLIFDLPDTTGQNAYLGEFSMNGRVVADYNTYIANQTGTLSAYTQTYLNNELISYGTFGYAIAGNNAVRDAREFAFAQWTGEADTDFQAFSRLFDSNRDGFVNNQDIGFGHFQVWQDIDQDGVQDTGELRTLAEVGIIGFDLNSYRATPLAGDIRNAGDAVIHGTAEFIRADGTRGVLADAELRYFTNGYRTETVGARTTITYDNGTRIISDATATGSIYAITRAGAVLALGTVVINADGSSQETVINGNGTGGVEESVSNYSAQGVLLASTTTSDNVMTADFIRNFDGSTRVRGLNTDGTESVVIDTAVDGSFVLNGNGPPGEHVTLAVNAEGEITLVDAVDTTGRARVEFDRGSAVWSVFAQAWNGTTLATHEITYDSGMIVSTRYDADGEIGAVDDENWSSILHQTDTQGRLDIEYGYYDNGARWVTDFDQASTSNIDTNAFVFDSLNRVDHQTVRFDDGTSMGIDWDQADTDNLTSNIAGDFRYIQTMFDAAGNLDVQNGVYDDGSRWVVDWDVTNSYAWDMIATYWDALNRLDWQSGLNDSGTAWVTDWDNLSASGVSTFISSNDASGALDWQYVLRDDGSSMNIDYDNGNLFNWTTCTTVYTVALPQNQVWEYDNQTTLAIDFDATGQNAWDQIHTFFDHGIAISRTTYYDAGNSSIIYF